MTKLKFDDLLILTYQKKFQEIMIVGGIIMAEKKIS